MAIWNFGSAYRNCWTNWIAAQSEDLRNESRFRGTMGDWVINLSGFDLLSHLN